MNAQEKEETEVENKAVYTQEQVNKMQMQMRAAYQRQYQMYVNNFRANQMNHQNAHNAQKVNYMKVQNVRTKVKFEDNK